ncbi:hypothetical protein T440DRAFT_447993 [Plenodomus tracheiphilus IPT5]|uniref:Uncharacterized protein n=1 Tax=Plenodomus tracheiphilus IPT5 TaxID=1408161 RepID=A0A6A7B885_9PLEO|nr:hypothetical protein T440DRAFT_447993 [Plenodomus tracheiphilus IPT5]
MSHHGQKVTTDPESYKNPIHEGVGTITSDSLAAESLKDPSGTFGSQNPKAAASSQPSNSTNTNNTDTTSATRLDPAVDAHAREAQDSWNEEATLSSSKGLGRESGVGPTYNPIGSAVNSHGDRRGVSTGAEVGADGVQGNVAPVEAYAGQELGGGVFKPKGKNITEDTNLHGDRKFGAVGTREDPGRVAEREVVKKASAVGGGADGAVGGESRFGVLGDEGA